MTTYSDIGVALGRPITDLNEQAQIQWWIGLAETQIEARLGDLSELDQDRLHKVVVEAVAAKAQNPGNVQYEAVDDYRYGLPAESRRVTITDEQWSLLSPTTHTGAYSVRPGFEPDDTAWSLDSWA